MHSYINRQKYLLGTLQCWRWINLINNFPDGCLTPDYVIQQFNHAEEEELLIDEVILVSTCSKVVDLRFIMSMSDGEEYIEVRRLTSILPSTGTCHRRPFALNLRSKSLSINVINCITSYVNCSALTGVYDWQYKYVFVCFYANDLP